MSYYQKGLDRLKLKEVTCWYRDGKYNHLADGHDHSDKPSPKTVEQEKAWSGVWTKLYAYGDYSKSTLSVQTR